MGHLIRSDPFSPSAIFVRISITRVDKVVASCKINEESGSFSGGSD